jgi:hypothetical protein
MAGKLLNHHKRYIREEDYESNNNRVIDKVLIQKCLLVLCFIIRALKEDPLSMSTLDVFFPKNLTMCLFF